MSRALIVHRAGPGTSVQDRGRTGYLDEGLSAGGAADLMALHEGAALLGQSPDCAALELAGQGGIFEVTRQRFDETPHQKDSNRVGKRG